MLTRRIALVFTMICLLSLPATAWAAGGSIPDTLADPGAAARGGACVPGNLIEAWSEGGWYPAVVLDPLRDGRCFVHYEDYGSDDDEALAPKHVRPRR